MVSLTSLRYVLSFKSLAQIYCNKSEESEEESHEEEPESEESDMSKAGVSFKFRV